MSYTPTHAVVAIQRAKDLLSKGKNGTNDAFATISLGKEKFQTTIKDRCIDPEWYEECDVLLPDNYSQSKLTIQICHKNNLSIDEFLGHLEIPLQNFDIYDPPRSIWYPLACKPGQNKTKPRGELEVRLSFEVKKIRDPDAFSVTSGTSKRFKMNKRFPIGRKKNKPERTTDYVPDLTGMDTGALDLDDIAENYSQPIRRPEKAERSGFDPNSPILRSPGTQTSRAADRSSAADRNVADRSSLLERSAVDRGVIERRSGGRRPRSGVEGDEGRVRVDSHGADSLEGGDTVTDSTFGHRRTGSGSDHIFSSKPKQNRRLLTSSKGYSQSTVELSSHTTEADAKHPEFNSRNVSVTSPGDTEPDSLRGSSRSYRGSHTRLAASLAPVEPLPAPELVSDESDEEGAELSAPREAAVSRPVVNRVDLFSRITAQAELEDQNPFSIVKHEAKRGESVATATPERSSRLQKSEVEDQTTSTPLAAIDKNLETTPASQPTVSPVHSDKPSITKSSEPTPPSPTPVTVTPPAAAPPPASPPPPTAAPPPAAGPPPDVFALLMSSDAPEYDVDETVDESTDTPVDAPVNQSTEAKPAEVTEEWRKTSDPDKEKKPKDLDQPIVEVIKDRTESQSSHKSNPFESYERKNSQLRNPFSHPTSEPLNLFDSVEVSQKQKPINDKNDDKPGNPFGPEVDDELGGNPFDESESTNPFDKPGSTNPFEDSGDASNPFEDDTSGNPFEETNDPNPLNPFEDDGDTSFNQAGSFNRAGSSRFGRSSRQRKKGNKKSAAPPPPKVEPQSTARIAEEKPKVIKTESPKSDPPKSDPPKSEPPKSEPPKSDPPEPEVVKVEPASGNQSVVSSSPRSVKTKRAPVAPIASEPTNTSVIKTSSAKLELRSKGTPDQKLIVQAPAKPQRAYVGLNGSSGSTSIIAGNREESCSDSAANSVRVTVKPSVASSIAANERQPAVGAESPKPRETSVTLSERDTQTEAEADVHGVPYEFKHSSKQEMAESIARLRQEIKKRDERIADLDQYLESLLVRVMSADPTLLATSTCSQQAHKYT